MGVYISLDIMPNCINQYEWEKVFDETLQLIQSYPFSTYKVEQLEDYQRIVLERTKEEVLKKSFHKERYWKINGDLESMKTGESFSLSSDLDNYRKRREETDIKDILLCYLDSDNRLSEVFRSKTQGLPYHIPLLAIASLIESRFPNYACVYGDITKEQAQKAVNWANTILEEPIQIPVRVDPPRLLERLQEFNEDENKLEAIVDLTIGNKEEVFDIVGKYFSTEVIKKYFIKELKTYESPNQLGAKIDIIRSINTGLPFEDIVEICCIDENGPKFLIEKFIKAVSSTWVMIEPEIRTKMSLLNKSPEIPDTVESQFGSIFLDREFLGRRTKCYIPKETIQHVLISKFNDNINLEKLIDEEYQKMKKMIEVKGTQLQEIVEEPSTEPENLIISIDGLLYWDDTKVISDHVMQVLEILKNTIQELKTDKDSQLMQLIGNLEKNQLIKLISQITEKQHNLILTRNSWDWIENKSNDDLLRTVIMLGTLANEKSVRNLYKALLENESLFDKFIR